MAAILSAIFVFIASYGGNYILPTGPLKPVLLWIGSRSYSLYLLHVIAFCATVEIWIRIFPGRVDGTMTVRYVITALVLLLVFSELTYRLVEQPFRKRGVALAPRFKHLLICESNADRAFSLLARLLGRGFRSGAKFLTR
jgi:peptidoglycan/LPS O-acetylase OafA/YrhL